MRLACSKWLRWRLRVSVEAGDGSADWGRVVDKAVVVPRSGPPGVEGGAMPLPHTPLYECPEGHSKCPFPS